MKLFAIVIVTAVFASVAFARPQQGVRRSNGEPAPRFSPAASPATLYIRPLFDRRNRLIRFEDDVAEEDKEEVSTTTTTTTTNTTKRPEVENENKRRAEALRRLQQQQKEEQAERHEAASEAAAKKRQQGSRSSLSGQVDPVDFEESLFGDASFQTQLNNIRLPTFGNPETILKATEELKQLDRDQIQFIKTTGANAGVLPLAHENRGSLALFPPLRPIKRLPKK